MASIRLLLDEDVRPLLAATLRLRGFDAVHALDEGLGGRADEEVFLEAIRQKRTLMSHNVSDFPALAAARIAAGEDHPGIVLSPQLPFRALLARTLTLLATRQAGDLQNTVAWLPR